MTHCSDRGRGRPLTQLALAVAVFVIAASASGCAGTSPVTSASSPVSPKTAGASPTPVDLTLPTTIHAGTAATGGAALSKPTSPAKVSSKRALALSHTNPVARLTGTVLADVTMPNDFYRGKRIEGLTCWVFVFTTAKPFDPRLGGPYIPTPHPTPSPMLVWHMVFIVDASNGQFVRGFSTK
jgi:hypothetical protein